MENVHPSESPGSNRVAGAGPSRWSSASIGAGLVIATVIVLVAWLATGQQGLDQLGTGGANLRLLPQVGDVAPDFYTVLGNGDVARLSDYRGQPLWLNFWGSWCPPCRSEAPEMQAAYEKLAPRGIEFLAIALDEPLSTAVEYAALNGLTYPIGGDPQRKLTGASYPIVNFPTHILIDRNGVIQAVILSELNEAQFIAAAEPLIAAAPATAPTGAAGAVATPPAAK